MEDLLLLVHRIPYPPNKGDKIRSYHLLRFLGAHYRVYLGAFVDDPDDWQYQETLSAWCADVCLVRLDPFQAKIRSLNGLWVGSTLTVPYYRDEQMTGWVTTKLRTGVKRVVVFSSSMAQYVETVARDVRRIIDFVDIDSDKWLQYSRKQRWPMSWLYRREANLLRDYEQQIARQFDASYFVARAEAELFVSQASDVSSRVSFIENGVDTEYFAPGRDYPNPFPEGGQSVVFTGAMDYWANVDAVRWFAEAVWPAVHSRLPGARFVIVGARPTAAVLQLARLPGVEVTGSVPDVRPYLAHASIVVAPLRIARGVQNKVLEAMAMGRALVCTQAAMDGIRPCPGAAQVCDEAGAFAESVIGLLQSPGEREAMGKKGKSCVASYYQWQTNLSRLDQLIEAPIIPTRSGTAQAAP